MTTPKLAGIDHFHLYVADKRQAVNWYQQTLGFRPVKSLALWDTENGPLTIEDAAGQIHLALFTRQSQPPTTSIAFKADGDAFLDWKKHLEAQDLNLRLADHQVSWSLYFHDPDDNYHEITTSDYQQVKGALNRVVETA